MIYSQFRYPWSVKAQVIAICYPALMLISYNFFEINSIHQSLSDYFMKLSSLSASEFEVKFDIMVCFQALGTIIFSTLLGHLSDKLGHRIIIMILSLMVVGSQCILHVAYNQLNFLLIDLGRCMCSVSFVCIMVPMSKIIKKYFEPENKFPLYNAILVSFWILGSILNSFIAPSFVKAYGIIDGELVTLIFSIIATLLCWILCLVDALNDRNYISQAQYEEDPQEITFQQTKNDFLKFRAMISEHRHLFISLMIQKGILSFFTCVASMFFYQYWGDNSKRAFFLNEVHDTDILGLFWIITFLFLIPAGVVVNTFRNHKIYVMLASSICQFIGLILMTIIVPFYSMPLLGIAMALRWASLSPIIMDRFSNEFGAAYGTIICLSDLVTLIVSLIASMILGNTGTYFHTIILLAIMQGFALMSLLHYIRYYPHKIQMEQKTNLSY